MYYTYILYSSELDRYYIWSTRNVKYRLIKHLSNHSGYTGKAKDWKVVFTESFDSKSEAQEREQQIKNWKSRRMIEKLID